MMRCKPLMGTFIEIQIEFDSTKMGKSCDHEHFIAAAFREIERVEYLMSIFENRSDISIINQTVSSSNQPSLEIHPWTYEVLKTAKLLHKMTKGAFDCGVGHVLNTWGLRSQMKEFNHMLSNYSIANIELQKNHSVRVHHPVLLDLGGIAKGYAVDRAMNKLKSYGIEKAVVNAGGDLRVMGSVPKKVLLRYLGEKTEFIEFGKFTDIAIATSSSLIRDHSEIMQSQHLMNPFQKEPIIGKELFTVTAGSCMLADALTKALAVDKNPKAKYFSALGATAYVNQIDDLTQSDLVNFS
ncbi:FAD:protein FMN transferase [Polynucleobacter kasalickyi]|uniref:FAD:protein FMN transferase n=1 Tax=Polynucleobacter kasalickyi TaxID=1938817 RepID=A0A1W1ZLP2_9BURK|nr:FAD:protein FMN transferase [Polynucleobacter kasalickyi]SMC49465.1 thiamine biosynthesis lipoprotein [Polynucleobacter kasalickyi]